MNRRSFIQKSGQAMVAATAAPLVIPNLFKTTARSYKMGLQLFTIRDAMAQDAVGSLKRVAGLGYQDLETYGYEPQKDMYYGYKSNEFKQILDDYELSTSSGHYDFASYLNKPKSDLKKYIDQCIRGAKNLGQSYITWPWIAPEDRTVATFRKLPTLLNEIGEQIKKSGLGFAYHNHDFEFAKYDGEIGFDIIMRETNPSLVKFQLDLYWVVHSSERSPAELINLQPKRFAMWHIKDMDKVTRDYSELGNGSIDYHKILSETSKEGLEFYFLEQGGNFATNSMKSIEDSAEYFKKNLKKYF